MQLRRWVSNASATFKTRRWSRAHRVPVRARYPRTHAGKMPAHPCGQDACAPMRARCLRTHAGGTPAHPCERDARAPMQARCPRAHAGKMPAHPCGRDARAPMRARCPCTRAVRRASGALLRRWVSNASATFNTRRRDRAHRAPMRAGRPRTHASGTPARPCGQDARAPMRAGRLRTRAARGSIMLNCAMCDVLFGWRVAPEASCTDTEGCVFQSTGDSGATASYPALGRRGRRRGR